MLADTFKTLSDAYVYDPREKPPPGLLTFKPMFITTVLTADEVSNACKVLRREPAIGFDVEWNPSRIKGSPPGNVATVQLSTSTQSFVFPIKRMSGPARVTLSHLLCDQSIKKVGLNCKGDGTRLARQYGIFMQNIQDVAVMFNEIFPAEKRRYCHCLLFLAYDP